MKLKLGAQLYTVREYMKTEEDFAATVAKVAKMGYKHVQISGHGRDVSFAAMAKACRENGVTVPLTHTSALRMMDHFDESIAEHNLIGCNAMGVGSVQGTEKSPIGVKFFCAGMAPTFEKLKKAGKIFVYHNHRFEFEERGGKRGIDILFEETDPAAVSLTFDTYWAHLGGVDCADFIGKHKDRIYATHLKDLAVEKDQPVMAEIFTGNMNFRRILETSAACGVLWHFVELDVTRIDPFESLRISYDKCMETGLFE